jgi:hypothetical protein
MILDELLEKWLPGLQEDRYKPSIFWNNDDSVVVEIDNLRYDL